jgi:hypothetical protein
MRLPAEIRARFQHYGRRGGQARAANLAPKTRGIIARQAAIRRWTRERFGESHFATLGLPGGEMMDRGLSDLAASRVTAESLLMSLAAPRLRREGVPLPREILADADTRLYRLLESAHGELAHARYLALLQQAHSFANACRHARAGDS